MSKCERPTAEEKLQSIQNELIWGLAYRNYKEKAEKRPISPVKSPLNVPFEICRAKLRLKTTKKPTVRQKEETKNEKLDKLDKKPTLLDRNVWSQNKYMDFLSLPNPKFYQEPKEKKYKKLCQLEPCPPRFVQLAIPNKRRVFANWKDYADVLPTEMLMRYEEILHTDQNLDPKEARYYYKKLDRQKLKEKKRKKRLTKIKQQAKQKDTNWLKDLIELLANDIASYIKDEPLLALNYKQMLLSDGILERLEQTKKLKNKPSRKTKNHYKKTIIEVSDKMAVWIDTLTRFVDVQAIDSLDDIPPVSISSLGEDEGESEEYESTTATDEEADDDKWFEEIQEGGEVFMDDDEWFEKVGGEGGFDDIEVVAQNILKPGEGEGPEDLEQVLNGLDGDILEKLINILSKCSDEFLDSLIEENQLPDITYRDVLDRLKELREKWQMIEGEKPFLEQIMIDWAMKNDPENVDDKVLTKIHEVAAILEDMLFKKGVGGKSEPQINDEGDDTDKDAEGALPKDDEEEPGDMLGKDEGLDDATGPTAEDGKEDDNVADKEDEGEREGGEAEANEEEEAGKVGAAEDELVDKEPGEFPDEEGALTIQDDEDKGYKTAKDEIGDEEKEEGGEGEIEGDEKEEGLQDLDGKAEEEDKDKTTEGEQKIKTGADLIEPTESEIKEKSQIIGVKVLQGKKIKGHKPPKVVEHSPDTVCCLSLKTWAVWLLEITQNAHNWTQWMSCVIQKVREFASIVRGDIKEPDGRVKVLPKSEWRKFTSETEESIVAWRQYSAHVKDLSQTILDSFHGKNVNCCPKCLQDHLIPDVVVAHNTLQALTEAINCAAYWQRCLDTLVDKACQLAQIQEEHSDLTPKSSSESEMDEAVLEEVADLTHISLESGTSNVYEIEGFHSSTKGSLIA